MTRDDALARLRDELLTVKEYADLTRRHPERIRQLCRAGKIRGAVRLGGHWRIRLVVATDADCNL